MKPYRLCGECNKFATNYKKNEEYCFVGMCKVSGLLTDDEKFCQYGYAYDNAMANKMHEKKLQALGKLDCLRV